MNEKVGYTSMRHQPVQGNKNVYLTEKMRGDQWLFIEIFDLTFQYYTSFLQGLTQR